jgi:hypothetical protein
MMYIDTIMEENIKQWHAEPPSDYYRALTPEETARLERQGNTATDWGGVRVAVTGFDAGKVRGCRFDGRVLVGAFRKDSLQYGNLYLETGLYGSRFRNVSVGDNAAIHNLLFCANQHIGGSVLIFGANEISASEEATFGMSVDAARQYPINAVNENGGRAILPYPGMTCTDAYLWAKFRGNGELPAKFAEMTYAACRELCPKAGNVANNAVIVNVRAIRDSLVGPSAVIDGAELIRNSTILSDTDEASFIGPAVQIRDSLVGYGNRIDSAAQVSSALTGTGVSLSKAARVTHTVVGDCAQIACCEIANSLIMPMHAQHHNNSFLIAAALGGQSNVAAGATIGSNHNSRVNDGEIWAKRGFWPGLCVSLRHNSRFASFTMVAKGAYQTELNLKLPFSLVTMDKKSGAATVFPAFRFTQNMYEIMRCAQKFAARDKRAHRRQFIEREPLAPDTVNEIFEAIDTVESDKANADTSGGAAIKRSGEAVNTYKMMIRHYCAKNILPFMKENGIKNIKELIASTGPFDNCDNGNKWTDCGGAIIPELSLNDIINGLKNGKVNTWTDVHALFDAHTASYKTQKLKHTVRSLAKLENIAVDELTEAGFAAFLESVPKDCAKIAALTVRSRAKDYENPFRTATYESTGEMINVLGPAEDAVVTKTAEEMAALAMLAEEFL